VTLVGYLPALRGGFIWDDTVLLSESPLVQAADGLQRFWLTTEAPDYWPLTNTTFWIEWRLWGTHTTGYHVTNLVLHVTEALLLWALLCRLRIGGAYLAALLFAVHPVNVESVAWIAQRKNLVALLFFLPSVLFYVVAEDRRDAAGRGLYGRAAPWYGLSLASFLLALLGKGSVATLPIVLLLLVYWRRRRLEVRDLLRVAPFLAVAGGMVLVNIWFQTHGTGPIRSASALERVLGAGAVVWFYLWKALLPVRLAFVYPQWQIEVTRIAWWLPLLATFGVSAVLWRSRRSWARPAFVAWVFFCTALLPVMGLTDVYFMKYSLVADHYQHIALIAVVALVAAGWNAWQQAVKGRGRWVAFAAVVLVVGTLTHLTARQSALYADAETISRSTLELNPECWLAHYNLAVELRDGNQGQEALSHAEQAVRLKPDLPQARVNLGEMLARAGRHSEALVQLQEAVRLKPDSAEAHHNLGLTLAALGRGPEAMGHYLQSLKLDPKVADAHNAIGTGFLETGDLAQAVAAFQEALRLKPDYREARANLGQALMRAGRPQEALVEYEQAVRLWPDSAESHYNLGLLLTASGRGPEGRRHYEEALRLKPDYAEARNNLAVALFGEGQTREALAQLEEAVRVKPGFVEARVNLAEICARTGRFAAAAAHGRVALGFLPPEARPAMEKKMQIWLAAARSQRP